MLSKIRQASRLLAKNVVAQQLTGCRMFRQQFSSIQSRFSNLESIGFQRDQNNSVAPQLVMMINERDNNARSQVLYNQGDNKEDNDSVSKNDNSNEGSNDNNNGQNNNNNNNNNNDDNDNKNNPKGSSESDTNTTENTLKSGRKVLGSSTSNFSKSSKKLQPGNALHTIPLRNWKATDLTEEEEALEKDTHIIFSSQQPILPFSKVPCQMKTGNLTEINHELAYFILNDAGDVYQIGLELERNVGKQLSKSFTKTTSKSGDSSTADTKISSSGTPPPIGNPSAGQVNVDLAPKKMSHRIKIVEIQVGPNGIFAKTIPYKDDKVSSKAQEKVNLENELNLLKNLVLSIKKSIAYEKIEAIGQQEIEHAVLKDVATEQIDRMIFQIIAGVSKLYQRYMKENMNYLIQTILESRNILERVVMLRINMEALNDVMDLVSKNYKLADENQIRMQAQTRARLSMEYIRSAYLSSEKHINQGQQFSQQGQNQANPANLQQKQVQNYLSKLYLIEDEPSRERVKLEIERFSSIDKHSSEFNKINTYLDEVFSVPWHQFTPANWDINYAKQVLDNEIYGLEKVKQRIIEMIAVNQMKNTHARSKGFILLLQGPPGTGKTSIAKAVAKALHKESRFISFAGISDPSFFKGHRRTYVDSQPGVFVKELIKAQTMNPVLILDEIDKISKSSMGADPYYSLMEILNPEENHNFTDHYMDIKIDFSNTIFILTANNIMSMLEPLKNRLEIIEVPAYIEEEKLQISKKFIIPIAIKSNGINESIFKYDDQTISFIIKNWCYDEAGVRGLKRCFETIARKFAVQLLSSNSELVRLQQQSQLEANAKEQNAFNEQEKKTNTATQNQAAGTASPDQSQPVQPVSDPDTIHLGPLQENSSETNVTDDASKANIKVQATKNQFPTILSDQTVQQLNLPVLDLTTTKNRLQLLQKYLGVPSFDAEFDSRQLVTFAPGVVNILSVGGFVGYVMKIECIFDYSQIDKKGGFSSSGNLQQVLQESLTIAKINAFNILTEEQKKLLAERNVHIHFMSGSIPKDGPSAGIAICTAYLSLAMNKPVPAHIAMTGELSPIGEVCKIGGLQAKIIAAKTLNIDTIICPYGNIGDVHDFPRLLLDGISIYFVKEYSQVYELVFDGKRGTQIPKGVTLLKNGNFLTNNSEVSSVKQSNQNEQSASFNSIMN